MHKLKTSCSRVSVGCLLVASCWLTLVGSWSQAASFDWATAASGDFDDAGNWNLISGAGSFPKAGDEATFKVAGTYDVVFGAPGEAGVINVGGSDVTFRGSGGAQRLTITGGGNDLNVSGTSLHLGRAGEPIGVSIDDRLNVTSNGSLSIEHGSQVDVKSLVIIGQTGGTTSTLVVDGADSGFDFNGAVNLGGSLATGELTLQNDATGSISGMLNIGIALNNPTGRLHVLSGAKLDTQSITVAAPILVGTNLTGEIVVDGDDSEITMADGSTLVIGNGNHDASVTVTDEGQFHAGDGGTTIGNGGTLTIDGTAAFTSSQTRFDANGGLVVNSGGRVVVEDGWLRVSGGDFDNTGGGILDLRSGEIQISAGEFRPNDLTFSIASQTADESLTISISNAATWTNATSISVGGANEGNLNISGSGTVETGNLTINGQGRLGMGFVSELTTDSATVAGEAFLTNSAHWSSSGSISLTGELTLQGNSLLEVSTLFNSTGKLILDGGTIDAASILDPITFLRGTVNLRNGVDIGGSGFNPFDSNLSLEPLQNVTTPVTTQIRSGYALSLNGGSLTTHDLDVDGQLHFNSGVLELTGGTLTGLSQLTVPANGELRVMGNYAVRLLSLPGSIITATGDLTLGDATAVNGFGSSGILDVGGNTVTLQDANAVVFDSLSLVQIGQFITPGTLIAANGLTLDFGGNIVGRGTVDTPNDPAKPLINNGSITGESLSSPITLTGYVKGVGSCENCVITGTDAPGFSPATVIRGNMGYEGTLEIEIGGTSPGSYDRIEHILGSGIADLGGTMNVSLINGFMPALGDTFEIITASSVVDMFDIELFPELIGLDWNVLYGATNVVLEVVADVDLDADGDIDGNDFLLIQRTNPALIPTWETQFGLSLAEVTASQAVPEPAGLALALTAVFAVLARRRMS